MIVPSRTSYWKNIRLGSGNSTSFSIPPPLPKNLTCWPMYI